MTQLDKYGTENCDYLNRIVSCSFFLISFLYILFLCCIVAVIVGRHVVFILFFYREDNFVF